MPDDSSARSRSPISNLSPRLAILSACAILVLIYLLTMPPTITWFHHGLDSGELATAVAQGSIPHPPGFPTYLVLGGVFNLLPWGEPAWRLNLMSATLAAGAAGLTALAVRKTGACTQSPTRNLQLAVCVAPICTALGLGLAPLFWSQALITEVYAPAAFFTALVTYLALGTGSAWMLGLVWGVGIGAHPTLLFMAPVVAWRVWESGGTRWCRLIQVALPTLLGWGIMYGPVLLARGDVPSPWGDVSTFEGWWALVSARMYHGYLFGLPLPAWPQRVLAWAGLLARQFTPVGATLAVLGWTYLWRERRALALASALAFGAFSLYAIGYNTRDSLVYLVVVLPLIALWLGIGLLRAANWLTRRVRWGAGLLLLLPVLQALLFWGQVNLSDDRMATEWARQVLQPAPPQAIVLTDQDGDTFALWYVHHVLGVRPDVTIVDVDLWAQEPYRRMMSDVLQVEPGENGLSPQEAAHRTGRPVVVMTSDQQDE